MIRPESITMVAPEAATLSGSVDRVSFVGDRQRLTVSEATQRPLLLDIPNSLDVKLGQRIGLAIDPSAIRILPGDSS
jgi:putative spermidine/putrescine transport system ATP-binding protein